jgi:Ni/Fe-hydrogenase subunit HybB-like protein
MAADMQVPRNGYAAGSVTKAPPWHSLVGWDLLLNSMATGLFLVAAVADFVGDVAFTPAVKAAYPLALVLLTADLICLVLDLGDPWRFHHMLRVFKPTSPMSLGTWCLTIYSLPLTVAAALSLWPADGPALEWSRRAAVVIGLLPALGSAVYKGVLLSTSAQPGWRDARWLGAYLANSALVLGGAGLLLLCVLLGQDRAGAVMRRALVLLIALNGVPLCLLIVNVRRALSRVYSARQLVRLAVLCVGLGMLMPVALLLADGGAVSVLIAVSLLLLGSLAARFTILRLPHQESGVRSHGPDPT